MSNETPEERAIRIFKEDDEKREIEYQANREKYFREELKERVERRRECIKKLDINKDNIRDIKPRTLRDFLSWLIYVANKGDNLKDEEEEYLLVGKELKYRWLAINEKLRERHTETVREFGMFDY